MASTAYGPRPRRPSVNNQLKRTSFYFRKSVVVYSNRGLLSMVAIGFFPLTLIACVFIHQSITIAEPFLLTFSLALSTDISAVPCKYWLTAIVMINGNAWIFDYAIWLSPKTFHWPAKGKKKREEKCNYKLVACRQIFWILSILNENIACVGFICGMHIAWDFYS